LGTERRPSPRALARGKRVRYQASAPSGGETELLVCPRIKVAVPILANSKGWFFKCVLPCNSLGLAYFFHKKIRNSLAYVSMH
jgi:hypothetical protein